MAKEKEELREEVSEEKQTDVKEESTNTDSETKVETDSDVDAIKMLEAEKEELSDKYMRAQAEIVNMRRRNEKEQAALIKYDGQKLAKAILPALDNLERALAVESGSEHSEQLQKGVEMVQTELLKALGESDVAEIEAQGQAFDPNLHQAVQTVPVDDDHPADTVVQVLQKGYILKDRVLRPAMVIVAQ